MEKLMTIYEVVTIKPDVGCIFCDKFNSDNDINF